MQVLMSRIIIGIRGRSPAGEPASHRSNQYNTLNGQLALLIPSLSTQPLVVTQIVDRKNADEWAMGLAVLAGAAIAYIAYLARNSSTAARRASGDRPETAGLADRALERIRIAARCRSALFLMLPLVLISPLAISFVVGHSNFEEWMGFSALVACIELYQIGRLWNRSNSEIRVQLRHLADATRHDPAVMRLQLRERLGRRLFTELEQFDLRYK